MLSSFRPAEDRAPRRLAPPWRWFLQLLLIAALVVVARAPFLVQGERFFDSDEAVEGLMARHVLQGEYPAFLWGQRYKGVPEVYLAAAVFAVAGSSVVALKSVTLACFALFVCLQFVLVERVFSRTIAWLSTSLLIAGPPSLVLWSLSANAEVVMTLLAGTTMYLGFDVWRRTGSRAALMTACGAAGFGLWVHQYILYYCVALGLAVLHSLPQRRKVLAHLFKASEMPRWSRAATTVLAIVGLGYVALGSLAFLGGGFEVSLFGIPIGVRHAQKAWQIAAALLLVAGGARICSIAVRRLPSAASILSAAALAFAVGYGPALAAQTTGGGGPPIGRTDIHGVAAALPPLVTQVGPIVLGFRSPTTGWLGIPSWLALPLAIAIAASFLALRERPYTPVFHFLLATTPVIFLLSGSYIDAQSYRYLMPAAGALTVVVGLGVFRIHRWSRVAGAASLVLILTLFGLQQRAWYLQLAPDVQARAAMACLEQAGVTAAFADYWLGYKLTFLAQERLIVAPDTGVDRYPPFTAYVRAQPRAPRIPDKIGSSCAQDNSSLR